MFNTAVDPLFVFVQAAAVPPALGSFFFLSVTQSGSRGQCLRSGFCCGLSVVSGCVCSCNERLCVCVKERERERELCSPVLLADVW